MTPVVLRRLPALLVLSACSAFGVDDQPDPGAPPTTVDAGTSSSGGSTDAGEEPDALADGPARDSDSSGFCPVGAVQCEGFEQADFSVTWSTKPKLLFKLVPNDDPVHRGVGKVGFDTKSWSAPLEDALSKDYPLSGTARTVALDFLVRNDQFPNGQIVEVAKLYADHFLVRIVLATSADNVVSVDLSPFSRDTNQQLATPLQVGVISDHGWHSIHFEVSTADAPVSSVQSKFSAQLDANPAKGGDVPAPEGKTTTQGVRSVVGVSYLADFVGPTHFAIDEIFVTAH